MEPTTTRPQTTSSNAQAAVLEPGSGLVVGIGASAGSLDALQRFFAALPQGSGLTLVVVQHLQRHHPSVLAELLSKHASMPIVQAEDGMRALPDHAYVIPPNGLLTVEQRVLRVAKPAETGLRTPIDAFFQSLARDQGKAAVGILVSGTGTDGTAGLRTIKEHGGLTLAQAPETAKYDGMPESAIAAGLVDEALPVEAMPARLKAYAHRLADIQRGAAEDVDAEVAARLQEICGILLRQTGHDFGRYKEGTLVRRIGRRVRIEDARSVHEYVQRLERDAPEAVALVRDLSIGVTHFFRDKEAFDTLAAQCLPAILDNRDASAPARVWVAGCASGEEAYSIAILMHERLSRLGLKRGDRVFATDIDSELVATARQGRYTEEIRDHVSPERLERYFVHDDRTYRVAKALRDMCTFSVHSVIKDPPFSSLDLISCRNVLIYLESDLQEKLAMLFHFALRPGGYLLLGPSEDLASNDDLFTRVDRQHRLFRRNDAVARRPELPLTGHRLSPDAPRALPSQPESFIGHAAVSQALERMIRDEYAPPCLLINERGDILYLTGRTSRYLQAREGTPSNNLLDQAHTSLRLELRTALAVAVKARQPVVRGSVLLEALEPGGPPRRVRVIVRPMPGAPPEAGLYAVVLQEAEASGVEADTGPAADSHRMILEHLEEELRASREDLQSTTEDLETSNEELKSANEELISSNEELQSANEELETSREELQTVNDELREKVRDLDIAQSDLQTHYASSQIATIFLDRDLRVTRFTPAASSLFHLIPGDIARPISDLAPRVRHDALFADVEAVLRSGQGMERRVRSADGSRRFLMRALPSHGQAGGAVVGVGITFVDITDLLRAEEAERRYGKLLMLSPDAIFVWRLDEGIETWNRGAEALYGFSFAEAVGRSPREVLRPVEPSVFLEMDRALREHGRWDGDVAYQTKDGQTVTVSARFQVFRGDDGIDRVLETNRDITERKRAETDLRESQARLAEADRRKTEFLAVLSHELRNPLAPIRNSLFVLQKAAPGSDQAERAKVVIGRQVNQLARLVDDLLDTTRISRGSVQLQRVRMDLAEALRRIADDQESAFAAAGVALSVQVGAEPVWVNGDPVRIAQAVGNLLNNAAKFTPCGGRARLTLDNDGVRGMAVIRVLDNGLGIEPAVAERMFQPFQQADRTLDRSRGGLGLGLALVKGLVELHGGEVEGYSEGPGKGAEFTIQLPLAEPTTHAPAAPAGRGSSGARRVLIIEDNRDAASTLKDALELDGHVVEVAYNGPAGLDTARAFEPDCVVCDIGLPGVDGYDVARAFRADEALRSVRLVALTGYSLPEDVAKATAAGFDEHLAKPPSLERLAHILADGAGSPRAPS